MAKKAEVSFRQVGRNLNVKIDGELFTKTGAKEVLQPIKDAAKAYDEKSTVANLKKLKDLLKPEEVKVEKQKEEVKAKVKAEKKNKAAAKKATKKTTEPVESKEAKINRMKELEAELAALKKDVGAEPVQAPAQQGARRRGEY